MRSLDSRPHDAAFVPVMVGICMRTRFTDLRNDTVLRTHVQVHTHASTPSSVPYWSKVHLASSGQLEKLPISC